MTRDEAKEPVVVTKEKGCKGGLVRGSKGKRIFWEGGHSVADSPKGVLLLHMYSARRRT